MQFLLYNSFVHIEHVAYCRENTRPYPVAALVVGTTAGQWAFYFLNILCMDDLFARLCSFENVYRAYRDARRGKGERPSVAAFDFHRERHLATLRAELLSGAWRHGSYSYFVTSDSKERQIAVAPFRDRVVHHALCNVIEPIFERSFIFDSYACRKGKGTHAAVRRLRHFAVGASERFTRHAYVVHGDVVKYFESVDHELLLGRVKRRISDVRVLDVVGKIIASPGGTAGLPIGNLTSQLFANIFLDQLDHFVKDRLGVRRYVRYMDDFFIIDRDPELLTAARERVEVFLASLGLRLHRKMSGIQPATRIDALGYVLLPCGTRLRKSTVRRAVRWMRKRARYIHNPAARATAVDAALDAWRGYSSWADAYRLECTMRKTLTAMPHG